MTTQTSTIPHPIPKHITDDIERVDWTPKEALRFYADGKHFDVVDGATRIIDTGAIASSALKHADFDYATMKGDVALLYIEELRQREATLQQIVEEANENLAALRGELDDLFWPVNPSKSRRQLINQIGQMNYRLSAVRKQNSGLESRNKGLREQITVLNRAIEKRKAVASALQVTTTAINTARRILQQIPSTSIELYEQAGEGIDQLDGALQIIGELDAATGDTNTDLSSTLDRIDLDFADIIGTGHQQTNVGGKKV